MSSSDLDSGGGKYRLNKLNMKKKDQSQVPQTDYVKDFEFYSKSIGLK